MTTINLIGAGGKMGCRLTDNFLKTKYKVHYLEVSPNGIENLKQRGVTLWTQAEAVPAADVVILAVPDVAIGAVAREEVPAMKPGALVETPAQTCMEVVKEGHDRLVAAGVPKEAVRDITQN